MLKKDVQNLEIDNLDIQILSQLMVDATKPYTEIAKELIISGGTVHVRMKKLEDMGIIKGSHLIIDPKKAGFDITAFLGIYLEKGSLYKDAVEQLTKITCRDTNHLRHVLNEEIQAVKGIQRTETLISLEESIKRQIEL